MKKPAVFMDRDGTINEQMGYINHISRFVLLPGVPEAVRLLNAKGFLAIVVSNQSGVARGYHPLELVYEVNALLERSLKREACAIDGIFFCPHHPLGIVEEFAHDCDCRKPKIGLIEQACRSFDIDMSRSFVVGDRYDDVELARRAGIRGILVETGYGMGEIEHVLPLKAEKPAYIARNLLHAVRWITEGN